MQTNTSSSYLKKLVAGILLLNLFVYVFAAQSPIGGGSLSRPSASSFRTCWRAE